MDWKTLLAYVTGSVDEQLLLRIEYLIAENGILRNQMTGRLRLSDAERKTLAEIGKKQGLQALAPEKVRLVDGDSLPSRWRESCELAQEILMRDHVFPATCT